MAANLVIPLRQAKEIKEIQHAVGAAVPWSMWRPRVEDDDDSWEARAFAEDAAGLLGGGTWPPRSYSCNFCRREFRSAQALGGHMNVHRRDRARLRQSSPSGINNPPDHHNHQAAFPSPVMMPGQEFPLCYLYPVPAVPNSSSTDQSPLLYTLGPNSSSQLLLPPPPLFHVPPRTFMASDDPNSNIVEFIPPSYLYPSSSSPSSSPPSTVLSISPYSPSPPDQHPLAMNNSSDSTGISGCRRSGAKTELGAGKLKQIGAFHPYLPRHQTGSSDEHTRSIYNDHHAKELLNLDGDNSAQDIDLELRLGQTRT